MKMKNFHLAWLCPPWLMAWCADFERHLAHVSSSWIAFY